MTEKDDKEIWPNWKEGVPTSFHRLIGTPTSYRPYRAYYASLELLWNAPYPLPDLFRNRRLLPSTHSSEWSGVYRVFSPNTIIDRSCGKDQTGTLYLGMAGTGRRNWSILRNRIKSIIDEKHHAFDHWRRSELLQQKFPWASLSVQWAYTGKRLDHKGDEEAEAILAEGFLLNSYNDLFGEYPPWNQRP